MNKIAILLTFALFLTGCGLVSYHTEVYVNGEKKAEVKSNIPARAKIGDIEIDQTSKSWWEKLGELTPKNVKVER